jgi:hypothetical protein
MAFVEVQTRAPGQTLGSIKLPIAPRRLLDAEWLISSPVWHGVYVEVGIRG